MDLSLAFESFMVFYLLEILILAVFVWVLSREYQQEEQQKAVQLTRPQGPSASELIKMRAIAKELQRQG